MNSRKLCLYSVAFLLAVASPVARAQATRTWVSGVGDDAKPCSRTAPCKTYAGAISKTATGGEISTLDPGGFGAVTISKAITISGDGTLAGMLAAGTNGVIVNAPAGARVVLRNLSINGAGTGIDGIRYLAGGSLVVDRCTIEGFTGDGIEVNTTTSGNLLVQDTTIQGAVTGIKVNTTVPQFPVALNRVTITGATDGVFGIAGQMQIVDSVVSQNTGTAILADGGTISVARTLLSGNGVAVDAGPGATIRLSETLAYDNLTGYACGGGTIATAGDNLKGGNTGGVVPVCIPGATITIQ